MRHTHIKKVVFSEGRDLELSQVSHWVAITLQAPINFNKNYIAMFLLNISLEDLFHLKAE